MANIRIIRHFTRSERRRLDVICDIYRECVAAELPHELRLEKRRPVHRAGVRDWVPETWINQMGKGMLKPNCEAIVVLICEYQVDRSSRWFGSGYRDDPYILFLEELKSWVTKTVSFIDLNIDARKILKDRIRYLEHVLAEPDLFDPFPTHKMTMQQVVFHVRKNLLYEMLPMVETEIANSSAREDIRQLQKSVRSALDQLVKFLYHIFRDSGGPTNITISSLRQPSGEKYAEVLNNASGMLLHRMVSGGVMTSIFKDEHFYFESSTKEITEGMKSNKSSVVQSNDYLDSHGNVKLPTSLLQFLEPEDLKKRAAVTLQSCFDHDSSGFESFFRANGMISATYLRCYGLCQELAKFVLVCDKAHALAGQGGDLLVYGVANAQINAMMSTYIHLTHALRTTVDRLNQIAEIRFEKLVNDNLARESANSWVKHFKKVSYILEQFRGDLDAADTAAMHIRTQANSMTLNERLQKAKEDTENFVTQADGYSRHVAGVLGIEYVPPKIPSSVTTDQALEGNDYNAFNDQSISKDSSRPSNLPQITAGTASAIVAPKAALPPSYNPLDKKEDHLIMVKEGITSATLNRVFIRLTPDITKLSLENNRIGGDGALALFEHVAKYCPGIKTIRLYHNDLGVEGARALAACITRPNHSLQKLDINSNDIGDEGAMYIIGALHANRTLTDLDLGYNGITDDGIVDLADVLSAPQPVLKFLRLSGNELTAKSLTKIAEIFAANQDIISIDVGDANENVPQSLVDRFIEIAHPRKHAYHEQLRLEYEESLKKAQEPKLKRIEASPVNPLSPIFKAPAKVKATATPKSETKAGSSKQSNEPRTYTTSSGSSIVIEELDDVVYQNEPDDEDPEPEFQVADFHPLIRLLQNMMPVSRHKEFGCVKKAVVRKAIECSAYGATLPYITMTFEEYCEAARIGGILEFREIKKKGSPSKIGLALTEAWKAFKVEKPASIAALTPNVWKLFISCCKAKPTVAHKKKSSFVAWAKSLKPELMKTSEEVLNAMIETAIYSGTLIKDKESGKYQPNLAQKKYPIDKTVCPPFEL